MTRTTMLVLLTGVLLGLAVSQLLPAAQAKDPETLVKSEGGVIVFVVEGQEKARIDGSGLHVHGDVGYSGAITDTVNYAPHRRVPAGAQ
jgi:hypothetical protein